MSRVLAGGPALSRSRVILRLRAAGREVRTIVGSPTHAAQVRATVDPGDVQPAARVSFIVADRDHDEGRLDGVAGCEFVDDRIRLLE
jgi:dihydroflavonol-4-reductase